MAWILFRRLIKIRRPLFHLCLLILILSGVFAFNEIQKYESNELILSYVVNPKLRDIRFFWKDNSGNPLKSIQNLKEFVEKDRLKLIFATNAGMFNKDNSPKGLFIQNNKVIASLDTGSGNGNFYLKPNGVFYFTNSLKPVVCPTFEFVNNEKIKFATQSGPMLVINGAVHPGFSKGSSNLNIRNGVGILPDNSIVFAMSKQEINFYDFAMFFKKLGCKNALYLDGLVSRTYLPEQNWIQTDGNFGVMIGVVESAH